MKILVTGGAGYIGSHICVELLEKGFELVVLDNFSNSKPQTLDQIRNITNRDFTFYQGDLKDTQFLNQIFTKEKIEAVIDLAAFKAVGESVAKPLEYYENNVGSVLNLLKTMAHFQVKKIVFSSSATVYGNPAQIPITETCPTSNPTNPYGMSKLITEKILQDLYHSDSDWSIVILRYFNPVGAHASGLIGENPLGTPNNLMPLITKVALGQMKYLSVFGNDYETEDGTGIRDYIHVVDLARGHLQALEHLAKPGLAIYNLGTGKGCSVLQLIHIFTQVNQIKINYRIKPRRPGDIAICYCDPTKSFKELGFQTTLTIEDMCRDAWNFAQKQNK